MKHERFSGNTSARKIVWETVKLGKLNENVEPEIINKKSDQHDNKRPRCNQ